MRPSIIAVALAVMLAGCSSPDPSAVLEQLEGNLACYDDEPRVDESTATCATRWGLVDVTYVDDVEGTVAALLEYGSYEGEIVAHEDGWVATTDGNQAAEELARQLGGDVVHD